MADNLHFQVDLKGLISLLSDNLYTSDDVFLRELLQNAVDAIEARKLYEPGFLSRKIEVTLLQKREGTILEFYDNGIGLTSEELHKFLSVIGKSSKRGVEVRGSYIGQFGIGLLSCFLVTSEIEVISKSIKEDGTYCWCGKNNGVYEVRPAKEMDSPGTMVRLKLSSSAAADFGSGDIIKYLRQYGYLIDTPIFFHDKNGVIKINDNYIPWLQKEDASKEQMRQFGEQVFQEDFFDAIPIFGDGLSGYAFVSMLQSSSNASQRHQIFLKNMFITNDGKDILPKWAFFIKFFINSENLTPTAAREGFQKDSNLRKAYARIETCLINYFKELSRYDVPKLKKLIGRHNLAIKALTQEDERVYEIFFPYLVFPTTKGSLTGMQIVNASQKYSVYYCVDVDTYRRISPFMEYSNNILINAGYVYDASILSHHYKYYKTSKIKVFEDSALEHLLGTPKASAEKALSLFLGVAREALKEFSCRPMLRCFTPHELPVLYLPGDQFMLNGSFEEEFDPDESIPSFLDEFSDIMTDQEEQATLYFNCDNEMILNLGKMKNLAKLRAIVQILYVQALLAGRYAVGSRELGLFNESLAKILNDQA